jgi:hypothetical protein
MSDDGIFKAFQSFQQNIDKLPEDYKKEVMTFPLYTVLNSEDKESAKASNYLKRFEKNKEFMATVPDSFNGPVVWKDYLSPVKNQGNCGGCWSFAATSVLADRFNLQSKGKYKIDLSPTRPILCEVAGSFDYIKTGIEKETEQILQSSKIYSSSCYGNSLINVFRFLYLLGSTTAECHPYDLKDTRFEPLKEFKSGSHLPLCSSISGKWRDMCYDFKFNPKSAETSGTPARSYRFAVIYSVPGTKEQGGDELQIRSNIYRWGPVATGFSIYPNFYTFDPVNEIYRWDGDGEKIGGHAVCIEGWGEENGTKFWWIRNSWGPEWGVNGYFKMLRGENHLGIEENVLTGAPDFFYPPNLFFHDEATIARQKKLGEDVKLRAEIDSGSDKIVAGGIDPYTGLSRRVQIGYPYFEATPYVKIEELPDMNTFVAGKLGSSSTIEKLGEGIKEGFEYRKERISYAFIVFGIVAIILFGIFQIVNK